MTPICFPYRSTESALSFFGSNFIAWVLRIVFVAVGGVEGALLAFARHVLHVVAHERLDHGHERAGDHDEVAFEHADDFKQRVVAGHDFPRLDAGDVHLGQAETASQFLLAPAALLARLFQSPAHFARKSFKAQWFDMLFYIILHSKYNIAYQSENQVIF